MLPACLQPSAVEMAVEFETFVSSTTIMINGAVSVCMLPCWGGRERDVTINGCVQGYLQRMVQNVKMVATMVQLKQHAMHIYFKSMAFPFTFTVSS